MIADPDITAATPAQKRRGVQPKTLALIAVGEAPKGFWVVLDGQDAPVAALVPKGALSRAMAHRERGGPERRRTLQHPAGTALGSGGCLRPSGPDRASGLRVKIKCEILLT